MLHDFWVVLEECGVVLVDVEGRVHEGFGIL